MTNASTRAPLGAAALALAGVFFLLFPLLRPWHDETTMAGAIAAMGSSAWVLSHYAGIFAFILVPVGLLALRRRLTGTLGEGLARPALVLSWLGVGLILPYFGAETFGLNAVARHAAVEPSVDLLAVAEAVRLGPVAAISFVLGLILVAVAGVQTALAIRRSAVLPRGSGWLFAVGLALYLPQFFGTPALRIGHGVLLAVGCLWLAWAMRRAE